MISIAHDQVKAIIEEVAATEILPRFGKLTKEDIDHKNYEAPGASIVTIADKMAEKALSIRLQSLIPGSKVVGEEAFEDNKAIFEHFLSESPIWILDPIDGTLNFARGKTNFGVIVSLVQQNQILAGWTYDPTSKDFLIAEKGAGAEYKGMRCKILPGAPLKKMNGLFGYAINDVFKNLPADDPIRLSAPVIEKSQCSAHDGPRLLMAGNYFGKSDQTQLHFRISRRYTPWDDAANVLAYKEAGGIVKTWEGTDYKPDHIGNGIFFAPDNEAYQNLHEWCRQFWHVR
jgi:fructose-1,6-bisphosphatase/inositol monophosphatase family enzyme